MTIRVLLVDDDASVRLTMAGALEVHGFDVVEASLAREALHHLEHREFDLVISDIRMPGMDGLEGTSRIRSRFPDLPVVLVTAYEAEGVLGEAIRRGAYTVVAKPVDPARLVEIVSRAALRPRVLVVDDVEEYAVSIVGALESAGIAAIAANNGGEAVGVAEREPVDVAILDVLMPEMDGLETLDALRALDPSLRVVGVTAHDSSATIREMLRRGAVACLRKPFEVRTLIYTIGRARTRTPMAAGQPTSRL